MKQQCSACIPIRGLNFLRTRQCSRRAVAVESGKPVCNQHKQSAVDARAVKHEKVQRARLFSDIARANYYVKFLNNNKKKRDI